MKKRKFFILTLALLTLFLTLTACDSWTHEADSGDTYQEQNYADPLPTEDSNSDNDLFVMEYVGISEHGFHYYRDTITDVLYVRYKGGYAGGLSVMLDPETGLPLTYTRYMEMAEQLLP